MGERLLGKLVLLSLPALLRYGRRFLGSVAELARWIDANKSRSFGRDLSPLPSPLPSNRGSPHVPTQSGCARVLPETYGVPEDTHRRVDELAPWRGSEPRVDTCRRRTFNVNITPGAVSMAAQGWYPVREDVYPGNSGVHRDAGAITIVRVAYF